MLTTRLWSAKTFLCLYLPELRKQPRVKGSDDLGEVPTQEEHEEQGKPPPSGTPSGIILCRMTGPPAPPQAGTAHKLLLCSKGAPQCDPCIGWRDSHGGREKGKQETGERRSMRGRCGDIEVDSFTWVLVWNLLGGYNTRDDWNSHESGPWFPNEFKLARRVWNNTS